MEIPNIFQYLAKRHPGLSFKLEQAGIRDKPEDFVRKCYLLAGMVAVVLTLAAFSFMNVFGIDMRILLILFPSLFFILKAIFLYQPDSIILRKEKDINRELVFGTRFLMIEIQSGVSLFDAMINLSRNYPAIGREFSEVIHLVNLGTSLEDALERVSEKTSSMSLRKVLWQILNSLKTGADIGSSLEAAVDQITREQMISVKEYGRKLNPLAMFYMIMAVIMPSIGISIAVLMANFLAFEISLTMLLALSGMLGFMQFMFYTMIKSMRPAVDI